MMQNNDIEPIWVFTDGACLGNPGVGGWAALLANAQEVIEMAGQQKSATNNQMELKAIQEALQRMVFLGWNKLSRSAKIQIFSDSKYAMMAIQVWLPKWHKKGFITQNGNEVKNRLELLAIDQLLKQFNIPIQWFYVPGHFQIPGNERVDNLAVCAAKGVTPQPPLFQGLRSDYFLKLDTGLEFAVPLDKFKGALNRSEGTTGSTVGFKSFYVAFYQGELRKFPDWNSCQAWIKGKSGAKFRKIRSELDWKKFVTDLGEVWFENPDGND